MNDITQLNKHLKDLQDLSSELQSIRAHISAASPEDLEMIKAFSERRLAHLQELQKQLDKLKDTLQ